MSARTIQVTSKLFARVGACLLGAGAIMLPLSTSADAQPVVIRGIPAPAGASPASTERPLAYLATFPNGWSDAARRYADPGLKPDIHAAGR